MKGRDEGAETYGPLVAVWAALVALTAALVAMSRLSRGMAALGLLTVAPLKAGLVIYYFMRLKDEEPYLQGMVLAAVAVLVVFVGMLFLDVSFR